MAGSQAQQLAMYQESYTSASQYRDIKNAKRPVKMVAEEMAQLSLPMD